MPHKMVFVVEDDAAIRDNLRILFESEEYTVLTACDGRDALNQLSHQSEPPCLIFLDLMMPVMSGFEFLEEIRRTRPDIARLPILVITAGHLSCEQELRIKSLTMGIVRKPFRLDEVVEIAKRHCH